MNRRGVALLAVLWVLAALSALIATELVTVHLATGTSRNRILLMRATWARESCAEILLARYGAARTVGSLDTTDLGRGAWCRVTVDDPASRLNVNSASPEALRAVLGDSSLADAILDWRDTDSVARPAGAEAEWYRSAGRPPPRNGPLADLRELLQVRGFDTATVARLAPLLTTRGDGRINPNLASPGVLVALPGVSRDALRWLARPVGARGWTSLDDWIAAAPMDARRAMMASYRSLSSMTTFASVQFVAVVEGGIRGVPVTSTVTLTLAPVGDRLAVIRRETM